MGSVCGCCANWWPWGVGVVSGPFRAPNRFVGFWVVLVNGPNTVCGGCRLEPLRKGRATTACWGGTGYLTIRVVAADGLSAGGWGRWCGLADGRPNGGHPDSVCGRVAAGAGEQRHADGGSGMGVDGVPRPVSPPVQRRSGPGNLGLFPPNGVLRHVDPLRWTQPWPTAQWATPQTPPPHQLRGHRCTQRNGHIPPGTLRHPPPRR